jgi:hypothetical protein
MRIIAKRVNAAAPSVWCDDAGGAAASGEPLASSAMAKAAGIGGNCRSCGASDEALCGD